MDAPPSTLEYHLGKVCGKNYLDNEPLLNKNVGWKIFWVKKKQKITSSLLHFFQCNLAFYCIPTVPFFLGRRRGGRRNLGGGGGSWGGFFFNWARLFIPIFVFLILILIIFCCFFAFLVSSQYTGPVDFQIFVRMLTGKTITLDAGGSGITQTKKKNFFESKGRPLQGTTLGKSSSFSGKGAPLHLSHTRRIKKKKPISCYMNVRAQVQRPVKELLFPKVVPCKGRPQQGTTLGKRTSSTFKVWIPHVLESRGRPFPQVVPTHTQYIRPNYALVSPCVWLFTTALAHTPTTHTHIHKKKKKKLGIRKRYTAEKKKKNQTKKKNQYLKKNKNKNKNRAFSSLRMLNQQNSPLSHK